MVRLKDNNTDLIQQLKINFNSTMVRLKVVQEVRHLLCVQNFNSTMVRLKGWEKLGFVEGLQFQFHYGTIKSVITRYAMRNNNIFQFHYGTIKRE